MESISNFIGKIKPAGEEECSTCGNVYPVFETPRGIMGACKPCEDRKLRESMNLPKQEDLDDVKAKNFINRFTVIPDHLENVTVNSYEPFTSSQIQLKNWTVNFIKNFDDKEGESIVVSGKAGIGKSHLAYATAKALKKQGYKVLYIETPKLLDFFRQAYNDGAKYTQDELYRMLKGLDLLVLDDIGSEYIKGSDGKESWASEILFNVLNDRQGKRKIITTNYTERQLQTKYGIHGERITSRMFDGAKSIRLEGTDYRKKKED